MNRDDAIRSLAKAGKSQQAVEMVAGVNQLLEQTVAGIRDDRVWSDDFKRQRMAAAYLNSREKVDNELSKMATAVAAQGKRDALTVFGIGNLPGDPGSLSVSRRDAGDRVSKIQDRDELREMLGRAERTGDEVLARAIAERALEISDLDTMNDFLGTRPAFDDAAQRMWDQQATGDEVSLMLGVHVHVAKPVDLAAYNDWDLKAMVTEPEAGDWLGLQAV